MEQRSMASKNKDWRDMFSISKIYNTLSAIPAIFFDKEQEKKFKLFSFLFFLFLYFLGIFMWGKFTSWGSIPLNFHDWSDITMPRLQLVSEALRKGQLPLHMLETAPLHDVTDRFLSLPDVVTTPQMILLLFIDTQQFVLIDIFIHYTIGAISLYVFMRKYKLSLFSFGLLFLLFNFNGYILSHYSVGHFSWASYYLFPVFFMLVFNFLDGEEGWKWVTKVSMLLFYMVLAGGQHHYVWLLIFLGMLMFTNWKRAKWIFAAGFFSGLLNAVRFIPPALVYSVYQKKQLFNFVLGYPSIGHIISAMGWIGLPANVITINHFDLDFYQSNYWEFNLYIGIVGSVFVLWGLFQWLRKPFYKELILPLFILVLISLNSVYWLVRLTQIPLFASERITSRIIGIPFVFSLLNASIFLERYLEKQKLPQFLQFVSFSLFALMFVDIWSNVKVWRLSSMATFFGPSTVNLTGALLGNHSDPLYTTALAISAVITLLTFIFLLTMSWKQNWKFFQHN